MLDHSRIATKAIEYANANTAVIELEKKRAALAKQLADLDESIANTVAARDAAYTVMSETRQEEVVRDQAGQGSEVLAAER